MASKKINHSNLKLLYWMMAASGVLFFILILSLLWLFDGQEEANRQAMATTTAYATTLKGFAKNQTTIAFVTIEAQKRAWQAELTATAQRLLEPTVEAQETATPLAIEPSLPQETATPLVIEPSPSQETATPLVIEPSPSQEMVTVEAAFQRAEETVIAQASAEAALQASATIAAPSATVVITPTPLVAVEATEVADNRTPLQVITPLPLPTATLLAPTLSPLPESASATLGTLVQRMTQTAKNAPADSPYHNRTWVTYYGRPNIAVMGILGEYTVEELIPRLWQQAKAYDEANGPELGVMPSLHLVYGMATKLPGEDHDHLAFLTDEVVMEYIQAAEKEDMAVILDIQIGKLTPVEAIEYGLPYLQYDNVHLAIDPEFAMTEPDQARPGKPIGFVTAQQVNEVQAVMQEYMNANNIPGSRILLLHQFLESMIVNKDQLQRYAKIDLTTTADGWGPPQGKIEKYNLFMTPKSFFTGFKLFYQWDKPVMTERQALGIDADGEYRMQITPNLIIYQ